jgi:hypothetical protein
MRQLPDLFLCYYTINRDSLKEYAAGKSFLQTATNMKRGQKKGARGANGC